MKVHDTGKSYDVLTGYICKGSGISETEAARMLRSIFRHRLYKKGDFFAEQGEVNDKVGFNTDGIFVMQVIREDGSEYIKSFIRRSEFLLASFDPSGPNPVSIRALCDSDVLEARFSDLKACFGQYPQLASLYAREAEKTIEEIYTRLEQFAVLDSRQRYELFRKEFSEQEGSIPQYLIASYLGITPTQLSRIRNPINKCK